MHAQYFSIFKLIAKVQLEFVPSKLNQCFGISVCWGRRWLSHCKLDVSWQWLVSLLDSYVFSQLLKLKLPFFIRKDYHCYLCRIIQISILLSVNQARGRSRIDFMMLLKKPLVATPKQRYLKSHINKDKKENMIEILY